MITNTYSYIGPALTLYTCYLDHHFDFDPSIQITRTNQKENTRENKTEQKQSKKVFKSLPLPITKKMSALIQTFSYPYHQKDRSFGKKKDRKHKPQNTEQSNPKKGFKSLHILFHLVHSL